MIHRFGGLEVDEERFELRRGGEVVPVQGRVLDTILFLVRSGGRLVTREDLLRGPWRGVTVSDSAFSQAIMQARRALGDPASSPRIIVTVRGKGFRLALPGPEVGDRHGALGEHPTSTAPRADRRRPSLVGRPTPPRARRALEAADRMKRAAVELDEPRWLLEAHLARAQQFQARGEVALFAAEADAHARLAGETGHPGHLWFARLLASARAFREARLGEALRLVRRHLAAGVGAVGPMAEGIAAGHLLNLALELGGQARARALAQVRALCERRLRASQRPPTLPLRAMLAVTRLQLGDNVGARRDFEDLRGDLARMPDDRHLLPCLVNAVDLSIAARDWRGLAAIAGRLRAHLGSWVCRDFSDWGPVSFHLGRAAREIGDAALARRCFDRARSESEAAGARCWLAWADHARARALLDTRRRASARQGLRLLERTAETAARLRMPALLRAARATHRPPAPGELLAH